MRFRVKIHLFPLHSESVTLKFTTLLLKPTYSMSIYFCCKRYCSNGSYQYLCTAITRTPAFSYDLCFIHFHSLYKAHAQFVTINALNFLLNVFTFTSTPVLELDHVHTDIINNIPVIVTSVWLTS